MVTPRQFLVAVTVLTVLGASSFADTVYLKSGEKLEGRVLKESPTEITLGIKVTSTIQDERVIKRENIANIKKSQPDEEAWPAVQNIGIAEDSLDSSEYQRAIAVLNGFVQQFPNSTHVAAANAKLAELQQELKRVDAGEIKVGGKWLSADQAKEEKVQITGRVLLNRMKATYARGQMIEAMNIFSVMEKSASESASFPDAVALAHQILPNITRAAEQGREALKAQTAERQRRLQNVQGAERQQLEALQAQELAQNEAQIAANERSGAKYMPLSPANDRTLSSLISRTSSDLSALNRYDVEKMKESLVATESAKAALAKEDVAAAEKALNEARTNWPRNEFITRLQPKITAAKMKAAEIARTEAAAKIAAAAKPKPTPTPAPTPAPAAEPEKEVEPSLFAKPVFWVLLIAAVGLITGVVVFMRKMKAPEQNILDQ